MSNYKGYLLKNREGSTIIDKYIQYDTYNSTPNQREDIEAHREDNSRDLYRLVADGRKTALQFSTVDMNLDEKIEFQNFFNESMIDWDERKIWMSFWNDEINDYVKGEFYIPNITYPIISKDEDTIYYGSIQIDLVEY